MKRTLGAVVLLVVTVLACSDSKRESACQPGCATGMIAGRVTSGGVALSTAVRLMQVPDAGDPRGRLLIQVDTDSTGAFRFALPRGGYIVFVTAGRRNVYLGPEGVTTDDEQADTLWLYEQGDSLRADFPLGNVTTTIAAHATYESEPMELWLFDEDPNAPGQPRSSVRTGAVAAMQAVVREGTAEFASPPLAGGRYWAALELPSEEIVWLPGAHQPGGGEAIDIGPDSAVTYGAELTDPPAQVAGTVTGAWMEISEGRPQVRLFAAADSTLLVEAHADGEGAFTLPLQVPEAARVQIRTPYVERWLGGDSFGEATVYELAAGEETRITAVDCGISVGMAGTGLEGSGQGGTVSILDETGTRVIGELSFSSVELSRVISFVNLLPASYRVRVVPNVLLRAEWLAQWFDGAASLEGSDPVVLAQAGDFTQVVFQLEIGGRIVGTISSESGLAGKTVLAGLTPADSPELIGERPVSTSDGSFRLCGLADGDYRVGAWQYGDPPEDVTWFPGTAVWDSAAVISIVAPAEVAGIDFPIP